MTTDRIIQDIEAYAKAAGLSPSTVTARAAGNSQLYRRLKAGGSCTLRIAEKLAAYMAANSVGLPPERRSE